MPFGPQTPHVPRQPPQRYSDEKAFDRVSWEFYHLADREAESKESKTHANLELSAPMFKTSDRGALMMNTNLALVAQALDMAAKLA